MTSAVLVIDFADEIIFANAVATTLLGYDNSGDLCGYQRHERIHHTRQDGATRAREYCPLLRALALAQTIDFGHDCFVDRAGELIEVEYCFAPIDLGTGRGGVITFEPAESSWNRRTGERGGPERRAMDSRAAIVRVIEAFDRSRMELSRALHDGEQQQFVNTVLYLRLAEQADPASKEAAEFRRLALGQAQAGIDGLRKLAAVVHPTVLGTRGLNPALDALATRVPFRLDLDLVDVRLSPAAETSIYFFCAEALAVLTKYRSPDVVSITTAVNRGELVVELGYEDFDALEGRDWAWPEILTDRAMALGGSVEVGGSFEAAPALRARVPLGSSRHEP